MVRRSLILDRGAELLTIYPEIRMVDERRNSRVVPDLNNPVTVRVTVRTDRQSDAELDGQVSVKIIRVIARDLPAGSWARIDFRGETWDLATPPTINRTNRRLAHYELVLRSRNDMS